MYDQVVHTSKHQQIRQWVLDSIKTGTIIPGDKLPSESELCRKFGAARGSVRQAIAGPGGRGLGQEPAGHRHLLRHARQRPHDGRRSCLFLLRLLHIPPHRARLRPGGSSAGVPHPAEPVGVRRAARGRDTSQAAATRGGRDHHRAGVRRRGRVEPRRARRAGEVRHAARPDRQFLSRPRLHPGRPRRRGGRPAGGLPSLGARATGGSASSWTAGTSRRSCRQGRRRGAS